MNWYYIARIRTLGKIELCGPICQNNDSSQKELNPSSWFSRILMVFQASPNNRFSLNFLQQNVLFREI